MEIEIGKSYTISPSWKKSFVEENVLSSERGYPNVTRTIVWRSGSFDVLVENEEQKELLELSQDENFEGTISIWEDFPEAEFLESWDGCSEDWESADSEFITEQQDKFYDTELEEEFFSFDSYLEEAKGYDYEETNYFLEGQITVEEVVDSE